MSDPAILRRGVHAAEGPPDGSLAEPVHSRLERARRSEWTVLASAHHMRGVLRACTIPLMLGVAFLLVLVATTSAQSVRADAVNSDAPGIADVEARARFEAGRASFADGRFEDALNDFQRAYELAKRPILLFNVGAAADRLRKDQVALEAFERYLAEMPNAENRAEVEGRIRVLREGSQRPGPVGSSDPATFPPRAETVPRADSEQSPSVSPPPPARSGASGPAPWILAGIGGGLAVVGIVLLPLGIRDKAKVEGAKKDTEWTSVRAAHDRAPLRIGLGAALLGAGVIAAAAGLVWRARARRLALAPTLDLQATGLRIELKGIF